MALAKERAAPMARDAAAEAAEAAERARLAVRLAERVANFRVVIYIYRKQKNIFSSVFI
jgi:hypothetical protein